MIKHSEDEVKKKKNSGGLKTYINKKPVLKRESRLILPLTGAFFDPKAKQACMDKKKRRSFFLNLFLFETRFHPN